MYMYLLYLSGYHGFVINDVIPKFSQYKWLDMQASMDEGDRDATTGFVYEPSPYVDRKCDFRPCEAGSEVAVVTNSWGDYSCDVTCKCAL